MTTWFAATTKTAAAKQQLLELQIDSALVTLVKWLNLPATYTPFVEWALRLGGALLVFAVFSVLARRSQLTKVVGWVDDRIGMIELASSDRNFIAFVAWFVIWIPGIFLILFLLKLTGLFATLGLSAGVLTAVAAASNRDLIGNISAGFALQARRHVDPGQAIQVMGLSGTLLEVGLTSSTLEGFDGVRHYIPNAKMLNEVVTNYSLAEYRRVELKLWFDHEEVELAEVEKMLESVTAKVPGQQAGKTPRFSYGDVGEKGQEVTLYLYLNAENWLSNSSMARRLFVEEIDASEVRIGIPQQLVLFVENEEGQSKGRPNLDLPKGRE